MVGSQGTLDVMADSNNGNKTSSLDASSVSCSICLDLVTSHGNRSSAKLQCGHEFHLDCIGSAFNMKGAMQCPNCRNVEKGQWLFANGSTRSFHEFSMDNWMPDEDPYELSYSEMPFGVHWCPFSGLERAHSSFEEVESPSTYHNLQGHHSTYPDHTVAASVAHSYIAYIGPVPPAFSNPNESVDDTFNRRWNGLNGRNEIYTPQPFPANDIHYQSLGHRSPPFSANSSHINGADQASVPLATLRSSRVESDAIPRNGSFVQPFIRGHGSVPTRGGSSFVSSISHPGSNSISHERIPISHIVHRQLQPSNLSSMPSSIIHGVRRFRGPRGLPPVVPASDHGGGFYIFAPPGSSGRTLQEAENPMLNDFHTWERDHSSHFPIIPFERDSNWELFRHATGGSDSSNRSGSSWQRHWS